MTYDGTNRKHIRQAEKAALAAENERKLYVGHIMSTLPGRAWMHQLLTKCNIFHTPFVPGAYDITAYNCGQQNLGLQLFADVHSAAPREYVLMMQEASQKEIVNDGRYSDQRSAAGQPAAGEGTGRDAEGPVTEYEPFADGEEPILN